MNDRSFGVTMLAVGSVMVGLYSQFAAITLLLTGSIFTVAGSYHAMLALFTGAVFLGITVAAYLIGFGFWTRKHWSWGAALAGACVLIAASMFLSLISTNFLSALLPSVAGVVAIAYLQRPAIRAELLGEATEEQPEEQQRANDPATSDTVEAAKPAH